MTKEHIVLWLVTQGRVSRKDRYFLKNISKNIAQIGTITENQSKLLDWLISKYQRQLTNSGLFNTKTASWASVVVVKSDPKTIINLVTEDSKWFIKVSCLDWKSTLIKHLVQQFTLPDGEIRDEPNSTISIPWSLINLKIAYRFCIDKNPNSSLEICPLTKHVIDTVSHNATAIWAVAAVPVGDKYYINNINESLLSQLPSAQITPENLGLLSLLGIEPSDEMIRYVEQIFDTADASIILKKHTEIDINTTPLPRVVASIKKLSPISPKVGIIMSPTHPQPASDPVIKPMYELVSALGNLAIVVEDLRSVAFTEFSKQQVKVVISNLEVKLEPFKTNAFKTIILRCQ